MILTIDTGMSNRLKIAQVNDAYRLVDQHQEHILPERLQDKIIQEAKRSDSEELALSSTWFISEDGKQGFIEKEGRKETYLDLERIKASSPVKTAFMYNDAEATALALNLSLTERVIQPGNIREPDTKTLVYLGTGFQMLRSYFYEDKGYLPEYGGGLMASLPVSVLSAAPLDFPGCDFLEKLRLHSGLDSISELRHTHLLSARGLSNIHAIYADYGEEKSAQAIIDEHQKEPGKHKKTFERYSYLLGACLHNFASTAGFNQAIYVGGAFAAAVAPHLNHESLLEGYEHFDEHLTRHAYREIPISVIEEPFAGNLGAAYGLRKNIKTTAGIPYEEKVS